MTYELRTERVFDAPPEVVFDAFVDPNAQRDLFTRGGPEGWTVYESRIDLRVGGTWLTLVGPADGEPDRIEGVFSEIDRPRRLAYEGTFLVHSWGRSVRTSVTITFEERDGKTLLTLVQSGFEFEADRDSFQSGWPGLLTSLQGIAEERSGAALKARHDTDV